MPSGIRARGGEINLGPNQVMRWTMAMGLLLSLGLLSIVESQGIGEFQTYELLVCPEGPPQCEYASIQAAIDAAPEGATVRVGPGTYVETLKIAKSLRLVGAGEDKSTLTLTVPETIEERIPQIEIRGNDLKQVWIEGLTLKAPPLPPYPWVKIFFVGILIFPSSQIILRHLTVTGYGEGIYGGGTSLILDQVTIKNNNYGLWIIADGLMIKIRHSQITDNEMAGLSGFGFNVEESQILRNRWGIKIDFSPKSQKELRWFEQSKVRLADNLIADNETGVVIGMGLGVIRSQPEPEVRDLVYMDGNRILGNRDYGVALAEARCPGLGIGGPPPVLIVGKGNEIRGNGKADLCPIHHPWPAGFVKGSE